MDTGLNPASGWENSVPGMAEALEAISRPRGVSE
jgi:hypothetical protein